MTRPPKAPSRRLAAGLASLLAVAFASCGYSTGLTLPEGRHSVGVEFFDNDSPQRDLEKDLQSELSQSVERMVRAPLVSPERSDLILRGRIVVYSRRGGIRSPQNELLETGVRITVDARLVRPTSGVAPDGTVLPEQVVSRTRFTAESGYRLEETDGERNARSRVLRNIADRVVLDLFSPLAYEPAP